MREVAARHATAAACRRGLKNWANASPYDQRQLVDRAIDEMRECLRYPQLNDTRSVKRRIRYIRARAKEYGVEVE